jgi:hypothetical protein
VQPTIGPTVPACPPADRRRLPGLQQNAASAASACQQALAAIGREAAPQTGQTQPGQTQTDQTPVGPSSLPPAEAPVTLPPLTPRQQALVLRQACAPDYQRLCRNVAFGGGRAIACLDQNASALSPGCRNTLASMRQGR